MHTPRLLPLHRRLLATLVLAISALNAAAATSSSGASVGPERDALAFLLAASAKDFKASGAKLPLAIRGARLGLLPDANQGIYMLCGSFKSEAVQGAKWTPFATIKTADYEQWLGGTARSYCEQRTIRWTVGDHAAALMQKLKE